MSKQNQPRISEWVEQINIGEVIGSRIALKKSGNSLVGLCPFHQDTKPSLSVSEQKKIFKCFVCGEAGNALSFVKKYDRLEFKQAVAKIAQETGLPNPLAQRKPQDTKPRLQDETQALAALQSFFQKSFPKSAIAAEFVASRKLSVASLERFQLGFAPNKQDQAAFLAQFEDKTLEQAGIITANKEPYFRNRFIFPIRDTSGKTIAFGGRAVYPDQTPKYLNSASSEIFQKKRHLYGLFEYLQDRQASDHLLVVEGYMDVVMLWQHGVTNAVASLGTALGEEQFKLLWRYRDTIVLCFDGDKAGEQAAKKAAERSLAVISTHKHVKLVFLPSGEDPDSYVQKVGKTGWRDFMDQAMPLSEFIAASLKSQETAEGKAEEFAKWNQELQKIPDPLLKNLLYQQLVEATGIRPKNQLDEQALEAPQTHQFMGREARYPFNQAKQQPQPIRKKIQAEKNLEERLIMIIGAILHRGLTESHREALEKLLSKLKPLAEKFPNIQKSIELFALLLAEGVNSSIPQLLAKCMYLGKTEPEIYLAAFEQQLIVEKGVEKGDFEVDVDKCINKIISYALQLVTRLQKQKKPLTARPKWLRVET